MRWSYNILLPVWDDPLTYCYQCEMILKNIATSVRWSYKIFATSVRWSYKILLLYKLWTNFSILILESFIARKLSWVKFHEQYIGNHFFHDNRLGNHLSHDNFNGNCLIQENFKGTVEQDFRPPYFIIGTCLGHWPMVTILVMIFPSY